MQHNVRNRSLRYLYILPCFLLFSSVIVAFKAAFTESKVNGGLHLKGGRSLLQLDNETECIESGIHSFPEDFFTQEQRQKGGVLVHFFILFYACAMIATICDDFFIPSLEIISEKLKLPPDVAGATFMAIGASSPELFSSILGSFVTEGDIGVGAVIGSAVFNILGITGVAGIALWNRVLDIDWYPMVRDCIAYSITVLCLVLIISDNIVAWWEAVVLLVIFFLYIVLMYFNKRVEKCTRNLAKGFAPGGCCCCSCIESAEEKTPLLKEKVFVPDLLKQQEKPIMKHADSSSTAVTEKTEVKNEKKEEHQIKAYIESEVEEFEEGTWFCNPPKGGAVRICWWLFMLPASALFFLTIPNSANPRCRPIFPLTFLMSIAWLGVLSFVAVWMVTIIGYTLSIPDSVSGLTILAIGASVPDLIASVLVTVSGQGNMAISNLVGSNNFDISICLGVPWLAKTLLSPEGYLKINSSALSYATGALFITLIIFFLIFQLSGWKLNRTVGCLCMLVYILFVILASLFEFNVFGAINPPTCYP